MKKKAFFLVGIFFPVFLVLLCFFSVVTKNNQAQLPIPLELTFVGEYSYDGSIWYPYNETSEMSALDGTLMLKGHFDEEIAPGAILNLYCNHIGISVYVNNSLIYMDAVSEICEMGQKTTAAVCGKRWEQILCPELTAEDEIVFRFINIHKHGNKEAYREAIATCIVTGTDSRVLEGYVAPYVIPFNITGYTLVVVAGMLLGASLAALALKSKISKRLLVMGLTTLFGGGYIIFDVMTVSLMDELLVVKTYGGLLCMMLTVYFAEIVICDTLTGRSKRCACAVTLVSGVVNCGIFVFAVGGKVLLFDLRYVWLAAHFFVCAAFFCIGIFEVLGRGKHRKTELIIYVAFPAAVLIDITGIGSTAFFSAVCTKSVFAVIVITRLIICAVQVVKEHYIAVKSAMLREEVEKSRIAMMTGQIQPHFLCNSLTSVMELCERNPEEAKKAIADFADYLRVNMVSLRTENPILFRDELEHIKKYLRLEKLRFGDKLEIKYEIQSSDFLIPALSIQPLVENAVKHGLGKKRTGGTLVISTYETESEYIIRIEDDGIGFEESSIGDDKEVHIGLENVRNRLEMLVKAYLTIESKDGKGTTVCVYVPKRREL